MPKRHLLLVALIPLALLAGCSSSGDSDSDTIRTPTSRREETPSAIQTEFSLYADVGIIAVATPNSASNSVFLAEREGRIWEYTEFGDGEIDKNLVMDISDEVLLGGEYGLLGMTFSPDDKWLYIMYSDQADNANTLQAIPYSSTGSFDDPDAPSPGVVWGLGPLDLSSRNTLLKIAQPFSNHNGGDIKFSPVDGYLYISVGDGGSSGDPRDYAQNPYSFLGSILRINPLPNAGAREDKWEVPADNPFADDIDGAPAVWATGVRNVWRMSFDPQNGDLWLADVGQDKVEEINRIPAGSSGLNLGWNYYEGSQAFKDDIAPELNHTPPVFEYLHTQTLPPTNTRRCSITGGHIYTGSAFPDLVGMYLYADYCEDGVIRAYDPATNTGDIFVAEIQGAEPIITFGKSPTGETLIGTEGGLYLMGVSG